MFAADETRAGENGWGLNSVAVPSLNRRPMEADAAPKAKRPWGYELRVRIAAALEKFIGESRTGGWLRFTKTGTRSV